MKIAIIYNICGIGNRENDDYYISSIQSILDQNLDQSKVVVSSCLNSQDSIDRLIKVFGDEISISWILDKVPVNVSFNQAVRQSIKKFGEFEGYLYVDSGCNFNSQAPNTIQELYSVLNSGPIGMVSARTNTDTGYPVWLGIGSHDNDSIGFNEYFRNLLGHYTIPLGKCINLHCQLFSHEIYKAYQNVLPDIFAGQCSESVLSFVNAAISKNWLIHKDIEIEHQTGLDVPSVGFSPPAWIQSTGRPNWDHPFIIDSILPRIRGGLKYGLGYEEIQSVAMHDETKFDINGYALDIKLKEYIKNNLFLQKNEFDYNKINSSWL